MANVAIGNQAQIGALVDAIGNLNGLDAYIPAEVPDEPLSGNLKMILPPTTAERIRQANLADNAVGVTMSLSKAEVLVVACMNFDTLTVAQNPHAAEIACLRALIASRGFKFEANTAAINGAVAVKALLSKRSEISVSAIPGTITWDGVAGNAPTAIDARYQPIATMLAGEKMKDLLKLTVLLPVFAAIEFQKTNHHYIDNDRYKTSYEKHFKSAQAIDLAPSWNRANIVYNAVHWLGPLNMELWKQNLSGGGQGRLPQGIKIKCHPNPAGTALCFTQLAIWRAIEVFPGGAEIAEFYANKLKSMKTLAETISKDRLSYHVFATLFGKQCLLYTDQVTAAMQDCASLAAVAQAFIETVAKDTDLARAVALKKHSDQNIALFKIAASVFKGTLKTVEKSGSIKVLLEILKKVEEKAPEPINV